MAEEIGTAKQQYTAPERDQALTSSMKEQFGEQVADAYTITDKQARYTKLDEIKQSIIDALAGDAESETYADTVSELKEIYNDLKYRTVRDNILSGKPRIDGRDLETVRALDVQVGVLPYTHGSALFTRGAVSYTHLTLPTILRV